VNSDQYVGGIVVTTGRLGDICKVGASRLVGRLDRLVGRLDRLVGRLGSTVGSTVGRLDGTVGRMDDRGRMDGRGSIVVRVDFGCPSWL